MTPLFRIIVILISVITTIFMMREINRSKLKVSYALFWILLSIALILLALFPGILSFFARMFGVATDVNFLFAALLFLLLAKVFFTTLEVNSIENKLYELVKQNALLTKELKEAIEKIENPKSEDQEEKTGSSADGDSGLH